VTLPHALERRLLNDFQSAFPLTPTPFADVGKALGVGEAQVIAAFAQLIALGKVSRIGPVFPPGAVGASTLAAMQVPVAELERVAETVSGHAEVNHNYEREHRWNLWFVATAADETRLQTALAAIAREARHPVVALPLLEQYRIDLGFDLEGVELADPHRGSAAPPARLTPGHASQHSSRPGSPAANPAPGPRRPLLWTRRERLLADALARGLPVTQHPYARLAAISGLDEPTVLARIAAWLASGTIKRFGVVVRHRALGWRANAMCVWDVPDAAAPAIGRALASESAVTLCYRRQRAEGWPYNLYCMLHGRERDEVERELAALSARHGLAAFPHDVLFSRRAFKQRGARYGLAAEPVAA
jgi:DNA-binding Lrp family transcriptional regulator